MPVVCVVELSLSYQKHILLIAADHTVMCLPTILAASQTVFTCCRFQMKEKPPPTLALLLSSDLFLPAANMKVAAGQGARLNIVICQQVAVRHRSISCSRGQSTLLPHAFFTDTLFWSVVAGFLKCHQSVSGAVKSLFIHSRMMSYFVDRISPWKLKSSRCFLVCCFALIHIFSPQNFKQQ